MIRFEDGIVRGLLGINGVASFAAAVVLAIWPALIPALAAIDIQPAQNFVVYLLAATELAVAVMCFLSMQSRDATAIRHTLLVLIVFHLASGLAGLAALCQTPNGVIAGNVGLRAMMVTALTISARRISNGS